MTHTIPSLVTAVVVAGLLPAGPVHAQGRNPPGVNPTHFQCYAIDPGQVPAIRPVKLKNQFGGYSPVHVLRPTMLCAPTEKNGMPVSDKRTHYVCYEDENVPAPGRRAEIVNQFGRMTLTVSRGRMLCVPSLKRLL